MSFDESFSKAYDEVNQRFADILAFHVQDNDLIWIHDYHLMTVPKKLRDAVKGKKNVKIGFFLHTVFPSHDFFAILPKRKELLEGLLNCDLVGFHTVEYEELSDLALCNTVVVLLVFEPLLFRGVGYRQQPIYVS